MYRIGSALDIHALVEGRVLRLGGVEVCSYLGAKAHSDGDVLIHAIAEAIIGALGLGDLGTHFPDTDPRYQGIDSSYFLREVMKMMQRHHYQIVNIDTLIQLEQIRLEAYKERIRSQLSILLSIPVTAINIKAGTNEKMDAVGQGKAIIAQAIVLLRKEELIDE